MDDEIEKRIYAGLGLISSLASIQCRIAKKADQSSGSNLKCTFVRCGLAEAIILNVHNAMLDFARLKGKDEEQLRFAITYV